MIKNNQQFLELFCHAYQDNLMESSLTSVQFLFFHADATALVKVELSQDFPKTPPIITIMPFSKDASENQKEFKVCLHIRNYCSND